MKKLFFLALCGCLMLTACKQKQNDPASPNEAASETQQELADKDATPANAGVLWYNNNAPKEAKLEEIVRKDNSYTLAYIAKREGPDGLENMVVDEKNGYIEYKLLTGDGFMNVQVTLYKSNTDTFIGTASLSPYDGSIAFWMVKGEKWTNVVQTAIPQISPEQFVSKEDWNIADSAAQRLFGSPLGQCLFLAYNLPRYGTEVSVVPKLKEGVYHIEEDKLSEDEKQAFNRLWNGKPISLVWDMKTGKFSIKK